MAQQLVAEALVEQAMTQTGIDAFDNDSYREGLDVFVNDFNKGIAKGIYTEGGIQRVIHDCVHYLGNRLRVTNYLSYEPQLLQRKIERPVFVMGIPRTGTTLLSNLLAADPARRSPLEWEIDEPVPPATTETLKTDTRALAKIQQHKQMLEAHPEMGKIYRSSPIYPHECVWYLAHDFKTLMIESKGRLPEYREFIFNCSMASAYSYHRRFLQLLQGKNPGVWNLKMPSHTLHLDDLMAEYPDARLVWTHRDPLTATGSFCSLLRFAFSMSSDNPDIEWNAENCLWQAKEHAERAMDFRDNYGEDRVIDVHYADLLDRPMETMKSLYAALGDDFTEGAQSGMQAWLDDNPQNKFGKHEYKLDEFGLTVDRVRDTFSRYLSRYDVAPEG